MALDVSSLWRHLLGRLELLHKKLVHSTDITISAMRIFKQNLVFKAAEKIHELKVETRKAFRKNHQVDLHTTETRTYRYHVDPVV